MLKGQLFFILLQICENYLDRCAFDTRLTFSFLISRKKGDRWLRLGDVARNEVIVVRCPCGRSVEYHPGFFTASVSGAKGGTNHGTDFLIAARGKSRKLTSGLVETEVGATLTNAFARIVDGGPRARMADIAPLVRRPIEIDLESSYPELGVRSFGKGTFHKPALSGLEVGTKRLFRIEKGDLVFNIVFAWEGAVAVAQKADDGRVGSHRFLTCVPEEGRATSTFLRYFFLTKEGIELLGKASPGGAGRNRTLGVEALVCRLANQLI